MSEKDYFLQYHLYTLALHKYLRLKLEDYDYNKHIGGIYYCFIRGMRSQTRLHHGLAQGVFYDKPPLSIINKLDDVFRC